MSREQMDRFNFRGVELVRDSSGWHVFDIVEPIDPTEDLDRTTRAVLWVIGVILWIAGKIRSRTVREEMAASILREYRERSEVAG